ncbi:hypothetical protein ACFX13_040634 [Malus domestica]
MLSSDPPSTGRFRLEKPGPSTEKNWGLFKPDMTPVYNAGVIRDQQVPSRGQIEEPNEQHQQRVHKNRCHQFFLRTRVVYPRYDIHNPCYDIDDLEIISAHFPHVESLRVRVQHVNHNLAPKRRFGARHVFGDDLNRHPPQQVLLHHT